MRGEQRSREEGATHGRTPLAASIRYPSGSGGTQAATSSSAGSGASGNAGSSASTQGTAIQVKGGEFFFRLPTKSTAKPGKVTFVFKNIGHVTHDFKINGKQTPLIQPGKTAKLVVTFKKGKYPYLCTVPGHAAAGMKASSRFAEPNRTQRSGRRTPRRPDRLSRETTATPGTVAFSR